MERKDTLISQIDYGTIMLIEKIRELKDIDEGLGIDYLKKSLGILGNLDYINDHG